MILYNILLFFVTILIFILKPFSKKLNDFLEIREVEKEKYKNFTTPKKTIWLHSASVGELDQAKAVAQVIKKYEKETFILQTVFSNSVTEKNFDFENTDLTIRLPLDFQGSYDWILKIFQPSSIIFFAWDTWPNLIYQAKKENVKIYLNSATWDKNSSRIKFSFFKKLFSNFDGISPVKKEMEKSFKEFSLNKPKVVSCGDSRFDSVSKKIISKKTNLEFEEKIRILEYSKLLILASTYSECEKIIFPNLEKIISLGFKIWIFPHKIEKSRIEEIKSNLKNFSIGIYSDLKKEDKDKQIILFDVLGVLAYSYQFASLAYVGGAIHNKVHNVLEPSYFGLGLITGKKIQNSSDAIELENLGYLKTIKSGEEFFNAFQYFDTKKFKVEIAEYVNKGIGSSEEFYKIFLNKN